jgi:hypothetical protein
MKNYRLPNPIVQWFRDYFEAYYHVELLDSSGCVRWSKIVGYLLKLAVVVLLCRCNKESNTYKDDV